MSRYERSLLRRPLLSILAAGLLAWAVWGQSLSPVGTEAPAPLHGSWSRVAVHSTGVVARAWTCGGPDVALQVAGHPPQIVNTVTLGTQDEPDIQATPYGFVVCYDQRTTYMHCEARLYDCNGTALGVPFRIDEQPTAWRPLAVARADGLVAFLWTGNFDNLSYLRLFDAQSATWLGGSSLVATNPNGDQEDVAGCWTVRGDLWLVWSDFHGGTVLGLELMCRVWSPATGTWATDPARLTPAGLAGDDRWPVCRLGPDGEPWVAWQGALGVWLKRGALAPELIGTGALPELAPPYIVYQRQGDVWAQDGSTLSPALRLNRYAAGLQQRPSAALAPSGELLCGWSGPSFFGTSSDAYVRSFTVSP